MQNSRSNDAYAWTGHGSGSTAYAPNGLNQLVGIGSGSATYDAKGNMTYDPTLGGSYRYSSENLLTGANGPITGGNWGFLKYDPLMRLIESGVFASTRIAYDGGDWIAEYSNTNAPRARYVFGPHVDEVLVSYQASGLTTRRFLHADERGSIVALSDDAGNAVGINTFDEYGRYGANNLGQFQFTGAPLETISDLYYLRARMYNYRTGTFPQTDPIGYGDQANLYAYVRNDPVDRGDPSGMAVLYWNSPTDVHMTIYYTVDESRAKAGFSPEQLNASIASKFTGLTTIGERSVSVTASAVYVPLEKSSGVADLKTVTVFPVGQLPHQAETGGRPYVEADRKNVHVTPTEGVPQMGHELGGHTSGAGDQYVGGRSADGISLVTTAGPGNNIMQDYRGKANPQTLQEILRASTNPNVCGKGVHSVTGAC